MRGPSKFNDEALLFGGDAGGVAGGGLLVNPNHRGIRDREVLTDASAVAVGWGIGFSLFSFRASPWLSPGKTFFFSQLWSIAVVKNHH